MKQTAVVNIYNFIRMSHVEPSRFIPDDFETTQNQIITLKQYGFPGTYALKYDALMEPRYQALLKKWLDEEDEISAWWEITEPLCRRAGVVFPGSNPSEEYDDRVNSAYSLGYAPEDRKRLVDAYMADFYDVFGCYPQSIGSWVLDCVTMAYARERYGVTAAAICRDQMGVDGFTLWGGWPNGAYFPSRLNEFIPAQTRGNQLDMPVFRLLGPDPIYNFEADVRPDLQGVYTLEPSWLIGRDPGWISWFFSRLCGEDTLGLQYAHVGQENNFLWENIRPGFAPQLDEVKRLWGEGKLRVETMATTARWFRARHTLTPPATFQASKDWDKTRDLSAQWYSSANYRLGLLGEKGHLRIRDLFLFDEKYPSRYLSAPMKGSASTFDALPLLFPQRWMADTRPVIRLLDECGREPMGNICYFALNETDARAELSGDGKLLAAFDMTPGAVTLTGNLRLKFDILPVFDRVEGDCIWLTHQNFCYCFRICRGHLLEAGRDGLLIAPENGKIALSFGRDMTSSEIFTGIEPSLPRTVLHPSSQIPPFVPKFIPGDSLFPWGSMAPVEISCRETGEIRYTLDGTVPTVHSPLYTGPLTLTEDTLVTARLFLPDGRSSAAASAHYFFGLTNLTLSSPTVLDRRSVFRGAGILDLLNTRRGSLDYIDGAWRGTLEDWDITGILPASRRLKRIAIGFLSHHRSGIVYPESIELYTGPDASHLTLQQVIDMPQGPGQREIEKYDAVFSLDAEVGAFRILARRYARMPQWCAYRGTETVFTMADSLILTPQD